MPKTVTFENAGRLGLSAAWALCGSKFVSNLEKTDFRFLSFWIVHPFWHTTNF